MLSFMMYEDKYTQKEFKDVQSSWCSNTIIELFKLVKITLCEKNNNVMDLFYEYWRLQDKLINYFLIDDIICAAYDYVPSIRAMIEECEYSQPEIAAAGYKKVKEEFSYEVKLREILEKVYEEPLH